MCVCVCVIQKATYPSWHIVCSGGFSLTLSHAAREQQGWVADIMQATLSLTLSFTCICIPEGAGYACLCSIMELNGLGDGCYRGRNDPPPPAVYCPSKMSVWIHWLLHKIINRKRRSSIYA